MMPRELYEARETEEKAQRNLQRALRKLKVATRRRTEIEFLLRVARREAEAAATKASS